ncbi:threonylcarbamoyladenosine tRNA methylthiotransferase isoform X1 [Carcharodon carcharias]|uniref:threonylcarbamoyladenosine tRNA methylthiotransferase isoform X1 n=1 Tax=Carcharodon carcharias TaxID=13397 RepID=UPI001B7F04BA|nr:threonylcarbamoyladenosine tRNA methylthiotransferase isoform X1 [Carcharodon carcharias]
MPAACDSLVEDIEDIVSAQDPTPHDQLLARRSIVPHVRKRKKHKQDEETEDLHADRHSGPVRGLKNVKISVCTCSPFPACSCTASPTSVGNESSWSSRSTSVIPGTQKIWVKTWGCSHNNSDGEYMAGQLAVYGYKITENSLEADLWLLNSCTVKNPAEDHFRNSIKKAQEQNKKVVVAGCVPQAQPRMDYIKGLSIIGVQQIDRVVEVVEETIKGHSVRLLGQKKDKGKRLGGARLDLPKIRKNPLIEIISINTGCLNACTYCKTKHARGDLASYSVAELVDRAIHSFQEGVCEIWLTSEDTGAYGRDIGTDLPTLLWKLVQVIPEGAMLRLGMTNPPYILEHLEEMAKILLHPRVYSFLHVPVQTGSDTVLMDMKREYCIADFKRVADFLKEQVPGITIATDIICGFPGETEADFQETVKLVQEYKFPSLFINQFYPRPGTPAAKMEQVPAQMKKQRTRVLSQLFQSYTPYDHKIGERQHVLITEESFDGQYYVAHNKFYEQVLVPKQLELMGKMIEVDIYEAGKHFMKGKPAQNGKIHTPSIVKPLLKGEVSGMTEEIKTLNENGTALPAHYSSEKPFSASLLPWNLKGPRVKIVSVSLAVLAVITAVTMAIFR